MPTERHVHQWKIGMEGGDWIASVYEESTMGERAFKVVGEDSPPAFRELGIDDQAMIPQDQVKVLLRGVEKRGHIHPVTSGDAPGLEMLRAWALRERIPAQEVAGFLRERLTQEGEDQLEHIAEREEFDLETPVGVLYALQSALLEDADSDEGASPESTDVQSEPQVLDIQQGSTSNRDGTARSISEKLKRTLEREPSNLVEEEVVEQLATGIGEATAGKVPLKAWLLNPRAAAKLLRAIAEQATTQAKLKKEISETTKWLVDVAANDTKRQVLLSHVQELEGALGSQLREFCEERGRPVPEQGTPERMALLLRVSAEMGALQMREREIARRGEELVAAQVEMQGEQAKNRMLAQELPAVIESARKVNALREQLMTEKTRHVLATLMIGISGAVIGSIGGLLAGVEGAATTLVEKHPRVALSFGAGLATFVLQVVAHSGHLSAQLLGIFALRAALVTLVTAVATGIGAGLAARVARREGI